MAACSMLSAITLDGDGSMEATYRKAEDGWWIIGFEVPMGPYETKAEAEDDARGVKRFHKEFKSEEPGLYESDSERRPK